MGELNPIASILGGTMAQMVKTGATSSQAQAEVSNNPATAISKNEAEIQFGSDYYASEPILPSNIAEARGYSLHKPAPEPAICEFCEKKLYYNGLVNTWRKEPPAIFRWADEPTRCDCEKATAYWIEYDKEVERKKTEEELAQKREAHRQRVEEALGYSGIKQRFMSRTFANFKTNTPERAAAFRTAKEYSENFADHLRAGEGLYIEGTFGTGKTHLAAAIALELIEAGYSVVLKTADDLFRDIKRTFDEGNGNAEHKLLDKYKQCDLLVIDDLGKEQATDWTTAMLYAIINDRYESLKPIIITTNFNEEGLVAMESPKGIGSHRILAILSRLHEITATLAMVWADWRNEN